MQSKYIIISVKKGDRIAQLICERIYLPALQEAEVSIRCFISQKRLLSFYDSCLNSDYKMYEFCAWYTNIYIKMQLDKKFELGKVQFLIILRVYILYYKENITFLPA